jgi:transposase
MNVLPRNWQEVRPLQAWQLTQKGWPQRQIAEALGVSEAAVSQWMQRARARGPDALGHHPHPGASRRLSSQQLARLPALWPRGAAADGCRGQVWPRGRLAAVIQLELGLSSPPVHVGRLLKARRWSPQKPARRARQRDEAAMAHWREPTWPALQRGRRPSSNASVS